ncbi:Glutamyl-tRNA(Gln) amidotransferase subunit B [Dorcoceras hygrometricum]|uniref:Glutamyl-tRNA(Gln) amidotransferase subunit B n=1 Tax=Dorcoceras hygrometricum TaxID=472368 RepID=A0A2Z7DAF8_9LAMI|nr:Glutamyl-tRNA(Gln) amidotransferase subunit B [Dorcoceras hygrometricum]
MLTGQHIFYHISTTLLRVVQRYLDQFALLKIAQLYLEQYNGTQISSCYSKEYSATQNSTTLPVPVQARRRKTLVYVVSHTVEAVVHLRSLGVLTAAGCGIGSVHAVVRSNLLVEPSEVEEGEM